MPELRKLIFCIWIRRLWSVWPVNGFVVSFSSLKHDSDQKTTWLASEWVKLFGSIHFLAFIKSIFLLSKKASFLSRNIETVLYYELSLLKIRIEKKLNFCPKSWVNPFEKLNFSVLILWTILTKNKHKNVFNIGLKSLVNPFKRNAFLVLKRLIFAKGLLHGFGQKLAIFPTFYFREYRPGKYVLQYSRWKKLLSNL